METFKSLEEAIRKYPDSYVAMERLGPCKICKKVNDLRAGVCFHCKDQVHGEKIKGGHRLWDSNNPDNSWYVGDQY